MKITKIATSLQVLLDLFNLVGDADAATNTEREAPSSIARTTSKIARLKRES